MTLSGVGLALPWPMEREENCMMAEEGRGEAVPRLKGVPSGRVEDWRGRCSQRAELRKVVESFRGLRADWCHDRHVKSNTFWSLPGVGRGSFPCPGGLYEREFCE